MKHNGSVRKILVAVNENDEIDMLSVASHYGFMNDERLTHLLSDISRISIFADLTRYYVTPVVDEALGVIYLPSTDGHPRWTMRREGLMSFCSLLDCRGTEGSRPS